MIHYRDFKHSVVQSTVFSISYKVTDIKIPGFNQRARNQTIIIIKQFKMVVMATDGIKIIKSTSKIFFIIYAI